MLVLVIQSYRETESNLVHILFLALVLVDTPGSGLWFWSSSRGIEAKSQKRGIGVVWCSLVWSRNGSSAREQERQTKKDKETGLGLFLVLVLCLDLDLALVLQSKRRTKILCV